MIDLKLETFENQVVIYPDLDNFKESDNLYLEEDNFIKYLQLYINYIPPSFEICFYNNLILTKDESFITFDFVNMNIKIPTKITEYINICNNKSLIVIPIKLLLIKTQEFLYDSTTIIDNTNIIEISSHIYSAHSNLLMIDNTKKTIEFFEPHGQQILHLSSKILYINKLIEQTVKNHFEFTKNYIFSNSASSCLFGIQELQNIINPSAGHCLAWSLYFIVLRILNTQLYTFLETQSEFIYRFLITKFSTSNLNSIIKKFITSILSNVDINTNLIKNVFDEYHMSNIYTSEIDDRIKYISSLYFLNLSITPQNNVYIYTLYEELNSYRFYPNFHQIMSNSYINYNDNVSDNMSDMSDMSDN